MPAVLPWLLAGALLLILVVWSGVRMTTHRVSGAGGIADALGNFIDVFDPARARADRELQSLRHQGPVVPIPDGEDDSGSGLIQLRLGPDGRPITARVRSPRP